MDRVAFYNVCPTEMEVYAMLCGACCLQRKCSNHGISSFIAARVANSPWRQSLGSVGRAAARTDVTEPALVACDVEPSQGNLLLSMLINMRAGKNAIGTCI